jgi:lambda family phage minor tail protein L
MTAIQQEAQKLSPSGIISLFTLDTTSIGGPIMHFVMGSQSAAPVSFGGVQFQPMDVTFEGLETSGQGALPTPTISVSNVDGIIQAVVNTWGDLNGCVLHRMRTYVRFLDGQPDADSTAFYGPDTFRIERKASETSASIQWELSAAIDQEGKQLPGRVVIRDTCLWRYRVWNAVTGTYDYSKAQCPYEGAQAYDINDLPVSDPSKDFPSRRIGCCRARFGEGKPWPFGGFPGVARNI